MRDILDQPGHRVDLRPKARSDEPPLGVEIRATERERQLEAAWLLDRALVGRLGPEGLARMAAHWCFFGDPAVLCPAKLDAATMVRTQLVGRYGLRSTTLAEPVALLRATNSCYAARADFDRRYPHGLETTLARRRRSRRAGGGATERGHKR